MIKNNTSVVQNLADWISEKEPNYPTFEECKKWIKIKMRKNNSSYTLTQKDEEDIKMLLKYIPMNQEMNRNIYLRYLDDILLK